MARTKGRELPTWIRWYTVEPQTYIRIGPGRSGSSTSERVNVSYRRTRSIVLRQEPRARNARVPRRGRARRAPTLARAGLRARQREPQRAEVPADRLQLAQDRASVVRIEPVGRGPAELGEAREVGPASLGSSAGSGSSTGAAYARASTSVRAPRSRGTARAALPRRPPAPRPAAPRSCRSRAAAAVPGRVDVVLGQVELVEVGAHCGRGQPSSRAPDRRVAVALGELLPVGPRTSPWWITSGLAPDRAGDPALHLEVRPVVRAADDVGDPELEVVDDRGELVRRSPLGAHERRRAQSHGTVLVMLRAARSERALRGLGVQRGPLALLHGPFVEGHAEPREVVEDRLLTALDGPRQVGVVDAEDELRRARRRSGGSRPPSARSRRAATPSGSGRSGRERSLRHSTGLRRRS